jgi:hemerythrin
MFEWRDSYSVGVHGIDAQHRNVFRLAAQLQRAIVAGEAKSVIPKILERLVHYTDVHFAYEERLMREAGYPGFAAHKLEHEQLRKKALQFQADFGDGQNAMAFELLQELKEAIRQHILGSDQKYAPYVKVKVKNRVRFKEASVS